MIVTTNQSALTGLAQGLTQDPAVKMQWVENGETALKMLAEVSPDLVIVDEDLGDMSGLDLIKKLTMINPMINTAAVTSQPEEEFHETSEGLGILSGIPVGAQKQAGLDLLLKLREIKSLIPRI